MFIYVLITIDGDKLLRPYIFSTIPSLPAIVLLRKGELNELHILVKSFPVDEGFVPSAFVRPARVSREPTRDIKGSMYSMLSSW